MRQKPQGPIVEGPGHIVIHVPVFAPGEKRRVEIDLNRLFESEPTPDGRFLAPDHYVLRVRHHTGREFEEIRFAVVLPDTRLMLDYMERRGKPRHHDLLFRSSQIKLLHGSYPFYSQ